MFGTKKKMRLLEDKLTLIESAIGTYNVMQKAHSNAWVQWQKMIESEDRRLSHILNVERDSIDTLKRSVEHMEREIKNMRTLLSSTTEHLFKMAKCLGVEFAFVQEHLEATQRTNKSK